MAKKPKKNKTIDDIAQKVADEMREKSGFTEGEEYSRDISAETVFSEISKRYRHDPTTLSDNEFILYNIVVKLCSLCFMALDPEIDPKQRLELGLSVLAIAGHILKEGGPAELMQEIVEANSPGTNLMDALKTLSTEEPIN